jgi:hypothetical protein
MNDLTVVRKGGLYEMTCHTDQMARLAHVQVGGSLILTAAEWATFRQNAALDAKWMEALDRPWQMPISPD